MPSCTKCSLPSAPMSSCCRRCRCRPGLSHPWMAPVAWPVRAETRPCCMVQASSPLVMRQPLAGASLRVPYMTGDKTATKLFCRPRASKRMRCPASYAPSACDKIFCGARTSNQIPCRINSLSCVKSPSADSTKFFEEVLSIFSAPQHLAAGILGIMSQPPLASVGTSADRRRAHVERKPSPYDIRVGRPSPTASQAPMAHQ